MHHTKYSNVVVNRYTWHVVARVLYPDRTAMLTFGVKHLPLNNEDCVFLVIQRSCYSQFHLKVKEPLTTLSVSTDRSV